ncbi:MAG: alpha/beta fold hydrolase [Panacagrimonas sp.]
MTPSRFVTSGDIQLAVYAWSEPAPGKPTLVLIHGYPDAANVWQKTAEILAPRYHVVAYDVRGAGRSNAPDHVGAFGLDYLVDDLARIADAVSPEAPVHLVCHDWGSIQSWEAVCTERMAGRIASFTSISGPCIDHAAHWIRRCRKSGSVKDLELVRRQLSRSWYIAAFQLPVFGPAMWRLGLGKAWPKLLYRTERIQAEASPTQTRDGVNGVNLYRANFVKRTLKPRERRTHVPVQVIVAKRDRFMLPELLDDLPQWVPRLWQREIDAGHWLPLSHPERLAAMASEFVEFVANGIDTAALRLARRESAKKEPGSKEKSP